MCTLAGNTPSAGGNLFYIICGRSVQDSPGDRIAHSGTIMPASATASAAAFCCPLCSPSAYSAIPCPHDPPSTWRFRCAIWKMLISSHTLFVEYTMKGKLYIQSLPCSYSNCVRLRKIAKRSAAGEVLRLLRVASCDFTITQLIRNYNLSLPVITCHVMFL